jgi:hypothetical protein
VPGSLLSAAVSLREALSGFEPALLSGADCGRLAEELAATEKACAAARVLAAARAVECGAHRERGFQDGAAWVAHQAGGTLAQARQALGTAAGLSECPGTRAALLAGEVSLAQASEITRAQADVPGAEEALLDVARCSDLVRLRDKAREHYQASSHTEDLYRQHQRARDCRLWRDRLGMVRFAGALPPEKGVAFSHRLEIDAQRARRAARRAGAEPESFGAYLADALAALANGDSSGHPGRAELAIVCDLYAYRRGHAHPGEACHIIDGGPIPVRVAKELGKDAFLKAVLHDGVAVHTVKHFGRHLPGELRSALDLGPVPGFTGAECADCGRRFGLEYDHVNPLANQGPTAYSNLQPRCWADHQAKTERDREAGLLGRSPPAYKKGRPAIKER